MTSELTTQQLDEIQARANAATPGPWTVSEDYADVLDSEGHHLASFWGQPVGEFIAHAREDVPALIAEVRRLTDRVAELEAYAHGCDGEGCVLPHSSWCEVAKKAAAAANDGCTCPKPWKGHPQPHAGYCWLVSPPRNEIEEMRRALAERAAVSSVV